MAEKNSASVSPPLLPLTARSLAIRVELFWAHLAQELEDDPDALQVVDELIGDYFEEELEDELDELEDELEDELPTQQIRRVVRTHIARESGELRVEPPPRHLALGVLLVVLAFVFGFGCGGCAVWMHS
jgi:HPt (histidine-containing phosphotransfer) domain-containing protein